jgi:hypothetical protein
MNGAMRSARVAMTLGLTAADNWAQLPVIADIGGAIGTQLASIPRCCPRLKRRMTSNESGNLDPARLKINNRRGRTTPPGADRN